MWGVVRGCFTNSDGLSEHGTMVHRPDRWSLAVSETPPWCFARPFLNFTRVMESLIFSPEDRLYLHHDLWPFVYSTYFPPKMFISKKLHPPSSILMVAPLAMLFWPNHQLRMYARKFPTEVTLDSARQA